VVQVSADAPLVDPSTASISTNFDQQQLEDIPVLGRNPYITAKLSGVFVNTGNPQFIRFVDQNGTSTTSVAGGPVAANLYLVDGVPITDTNNRPIVIPTIESIQDVKVQANTYDAQVGRTGGGVFNTLLRSGSNTVHGSVFGETRQGSWLANDFFANREGVPRPDSPYYNWGASLGGPVVIPHLYDGRNKTFLGLAQRATFRLLHTRRASRFQLRSSARVIFRRALTRTVRSTSSTIRQRPSPMRRGFIARHFRATRFRLTE
jgi:trimeric autotransporter adhesin